MSELKMFFKQIFQSASGDYSSKRSVVLICTFLMTIGFLASLFSDFTVDEFMYESIMYIVIAGLGFTGAEQFAKSTRRADNE